MRRARESLLGSYERLGGELLPQQRQDEFGGTTVTTVTYGWRDLGAFS